MAWSYPIIRRLGLGAHVAVVIALAAVPTALLAVEFIRAEQNEAIDDAHGWASEAAHAAAGHYGDVLAKAHMQLATSAAQTAPVADACVIRTDTRQNVWLVGDFGGFACAPDQTVPFPQAAIDEVLAKSTPLGNSVIGPLAMQDGHLRLFAVTHRELPDGSKWHLVKSIDVDWAPTFDEELVSPANPVVVMFTPEGGAYRHHDVGAFAQVHDVAPDNHPLLVPASTRTDAAGAGLADFRTIRFGDTDRIASAAPLPASDMVVMVGVDRDAVVDTARQELLTSLALIAAIVSLSGLIAWLAIERMMLRSVRKLRDAAVATANGALDRRVEVTEGPIELRELAAAFNDMTDKLQYQALHDQLTGLENRRLLVQRLEALVSDDQPFAVLAIDLDGFKPVNDTHGHVVGDAVLKTIGQRLRDLARDGTVIARTGGDEFLAVVPTRRAEDRADEQAITASRQLFERINEPIGLETGAEVRIGGCIGIAFWPQDGDRPDEVISRADAALYRAKKTGRNRYALFATENGEVALLEAA